MRLLNPSATTEPSRRSIAKSMIAKSSPGGRRAGALRDHAVDHAGVGCGPRRRAPPNSSTNARPRSALSSRAGARNAGSRARRRSASLARTSRSRSERIWRIVVGVHLGRGAVHRVSEAPPSGRRGTDRRPSRASASRRCPSRRRTRRCRPAPHDSPRCRIGRACPAPRPARRRAPRRRISHPAASPAASTSALDRFMRSASVPVGSRGSWMVAPARRRQARPRLRHWCPPRRRSRGSPPPMVGAERARGDRRRRVVGPDARSTLAGSGLGRAGRLARAVARAPSRRRRAAAARPPPGELVGGYVACDDAGDPALSLVSSSPRLPGRVRRRDPRTRRRRGSGGRGAVVGERRGALGGDVARATG